MNTHSQSVNAGAMEGNWNQGGRMGTTIQGCPRVQKMDTFVVFYSFVNNSVTCLSFPHTSARFHDTRLSISVCTLILHVMSSRFCSYLSFPFYVVLHFIYTFTHANIWTHTRTHTCTISTHKVAWREPSTGGWLKETAAAFWAEAKAKLDWWLLLLLETVIYYPCFKLRVYDSM